jgi:hypothetical protein
MALEHPSYEKDWKKRRLEYDTNLKEFLQEEIDCSESIFIELELKAVKSEIFGNSYEDITSPVKCAYRDFLIAKQNSLEQLQDETISENILPAEGLNKVAHKLVLLWELGIIQQLQREYKQLKPIDFARLIGAIVNETEKAKIETIKKTIIYIGNKKENDPINPISIKKVKSLLAQFGIETKKI